MSTKMKSTVDTTDVADQMATLRADISTLTSTVSELAKLKGMEVSDAAKEQIATAKNAASAQADLAKQQAAQLHDQANEFVRTQPATAVGLAAGLGFVIGMLMTRK
ncbi:MAG: DUF883 family protein [Sulfitobacter sp.]